MASPALLIRKAQLFNNELVDTRIQGGLIAEMAPSLPRLGGEAVIEARGNALLPGLHDHHLHLFATAVARQSTVCGPPAVRDEAALQEALLTSTDHGNGWIRGVAFHDSACEGLDRDWLDRVCPERPIRIQHRSGMLWILNSAAIERLHLSREDHLPDGAEVDSRGRLSGRFFNLDDWLGKRLGHSRPSLKALSAELAGYGITGVTDAGVNNGDAAWALLGEARRSGELSQRLMVMGNDELDGLRAGDGLRTGPRKIYLREAALPELTELERTIAAAHRHGRPVAAHCTTRVELAYFIAALESAGTLPGDRVEHASVTDAYALERIAALGLTVVTQPHFIAERGEQYLEQVELDDIPLLYRAGSFLRHAVPLAAGSDSPYGINDPWFAMRSVVSRRTGNGVRIGADEALSPAEALSLYTGEAGSPGTPRLIPRPGTAADLCLLDAPWSVALADLDAGHVAMTIIDGAVVHQRD
ncbi:amidohydrolase family protein [Pseudohaliea sp.]|uniref:amidohydrolase family protein n=1 Tax=Pseudohaliea sp. TaxID=2740289 RepID=UPI0032ED256C